MIKKLNRIAMSLFLLCCVSSLSGCFSLGTIPNANVPVGGNITAGEREGDVFTNAWSDVTFTLPSYYETIDLGEDPPGQLTDFALLNHDGGTSISLIYVDLSYGSQQDLTAEGYLDTVQGQLKNSRNKNYTFADSYDRATIAGHEYSAMRSRFNFKESPMETPGYQDGYARKFDNAIILFLAVYSDDTKGSVDSFLSSVKQIS